MKTRLVNKKIKYKYCNELAEWNTCECFCPCENEKIVEINDDMPKLGDGENFAEFFKTIEIGVEK